MYEINEELETKEILRKYKHIYKGFRREITEEEKDQIHKAFQLALKAHASTRRKSGEPYIYHPLEVAAIVVYTIGLGPTSVVCALLHDVVEDTDYTLADIEQMFGENVARIVDGLTKIDEIFDQEQSISIQAMNFQKMISTLSEDVRVILIKLADRLHNMRTLDSMPREKQLKIASETVYIYAPLAHRLGLYAIKSELEDLALKYTEPKVYETIEKKIQETEEQRADLVKNFIQPIQKAMDEAHLKYTISGRVKSICSIWGKMKKKGIPFEEVYDLFAIRIVLDSPVETERTDCYQVYSIITKLYRPNPSRLRDWIAMPKNNGYEAVHTTVMSDTGRWVEVQIRSRRMDEIAEKGYAAHWKYKNEGLTPTDSGLDLWLGKIREMLENADKDNSLGFINDFRLNFINGEVYVYTPKGELKTLPKGATVLDFAFQIHTEFGFSAIGGKVNQKLQPLNYPLQSGDQVQLITSKTQHPTKKWLDYVVTTRAKSHIRQWLRDEYARYYSVGEQLLKDYFWQMSTRYTVENLQTVQEALGYKTRAEFLYDIAQKRKTYMDVKRVLEKKNKHDNWFMQLFKGGKSSSSSGNTLSLREVQNALHVQIDKAPERLLLGESVKKINYVISGCCNPIPGDEVIGVVNSNNEIEIHRINCSQAIALMSQYGNRIVKTKWQKDRNVTFLTGLYVKGLDRPRLLKDIVDILSEMDNVNMRNISFTASEGTVEGKMMLYIGSTDQLTEVIRKLKTITELSTVVRIDHADKV